MEPAVASRKEEIQAMIEQVRRKNRFIGYLRLARIVGDNIVRKRVSSLAQSLAFSTILSAVPILAIFFSVLGNITQNRRIKEGIFDFISQYFIPEYANSVFLQFETLARRSLTLGAIGLPTLFLAGVLLYTKVDGSINLIWDARKRSKWFANGLAFFMTLFLGPTILVALFSIPPYLQSLPFIKDLFSNSVAQGIWSRALPFGVSWGGLWVLYSYIPNAKVGAKPALVGALFSAFLIQIANEALGFYFSQLARLDVIYGSLVAIPVLLIWVYVLWMVVLTGSALCYVVQHHHNRNYLTAAHIYNDESLLCNALETLLLLAKSFDQGEGPKDIDQLHFQLGLHKNRLEFILAKLVAKELVNMMDIPGSPMEGRYQLGQSAKQIKLSELVPLFFEPKDHLQLGPKLSALTNLLSVHPAFLRVGLSVQALLDDPENIKAQIV
ncbi:MAG: hypothetical protein A2600_09810 [Candidatus Lambdaproteobacteria bacterium RIFOXYD1_FULL_56_27]|uniref:Uncharacterized protein n=1 Tax=Candidatus Lambdaproteobacteria bacterium RIFOXYD2_FULL_56_26 TaxID=1817773 RepID=A0A1F6GMG1_9PROT|nr:MAG: hypothetical protein A2557_02035 [Candidatus Lambdaproteobacteria bacterium RIFOXYD2_FULL_56_26]OGH03300.1 MAG: hypothetical protein A2426_07095 [Candidatus Lambdaproteobacteria bacterium RIFOXYC1_FULL_56_13]OGH09607.1 MAG: hypothetical protein A2600_09810 [Candidatus Lambdaproteobacteria bacterium RIFOXYD1_FULL_56_27]